MKEQKELILQNKNVSNKSWVMKIGVFLVVLSCVLYGGLLIVPFIPYAVGTKAIISSVLIISGEISFWIGGLILGKKLVTKYRKYLNPFHR